MIERERQEVARALLEARERLAERRKLTLQVRQRCAESTDALAAAQGQVEQLVASAPFRARVAQHRALKQQIEDLRRVLRRYEAIKRRPK